MQKDKINDYTILDLLGEGAYGRVYRVQAPDHKQYALKLIQISARIKQKIRQEGMLLTSMKHANILWAREFFYFQKEKYFVIVTEFCNNNSLENIFGNVSPEIAKSIMIGIAEGIYYMHHQKKIVHRDLKPENILLNDWTPKIADLGLAKIIDTDRATTKIGTPTYMAFEMFEGDYDMQVDIWALGIIYIELLLGKRIFNILKGLQIPSKRSTFPSPQLLNQIADQKMRNMIRLMLKKNPTERLKIEQVLRYLGVQKQNNIGQKDSKTNKQKYRDIVADCYQKTEEYFFNQFKQTFIRQLYEKNLVEILAEAESGNKKAMYLMGRIYQIGCGMNKNRQKSIEFYQKAYGEEQPHSCYELYRNSDRNSQKYQYLMNGKQFEEERCIFCLADNYLEGKEGRPIDYQEAEQYISFLCQKQYPPAFRLKGQLCGKKNTQFYNIQQKRRSYQIGAKLGDNICKINLAHQQYKQKRYAETLLLCKEIEKVTKLQKKYLIEIIQLRGKCYAKMNQPQKVVEEFRKCIELQGNNIEKDFRGKIAEYFESISDHESAINYYNEAILILMRIQQKTAYHKQRLKALCETLYAIYYERQMYEDAFGMADLSSKLGYQNGKADKAYMIFSGTGVKKDEKVGLSILQKLDQQGNVEAHSYLQMIMSESQIKPN